MKIKRMIKNAMITGLILLVFYIAVRLMLFGFACLKAESLNDYFFDHLAGIEYSDKYEVDETYFILKTGSYFGAQVYSYNWAVMAEEADSYPGWKRSLQESYYDSEFKPISEVNTDQDLSYWDFSYPDDDVDLVTLHYELSPFDTILQLDFYKYFAASWIGLLIMIVLVYIRHGQYGIFLGEKNDENAECRLSEELSREMIAPLEALKKATSDWKNADESDRDSYSDGIITEVDRMNGVIKKLLKVRDLESGKVDLNCEEFNLYRFTSSVVEHLDPILNKKKIQVSVDSENEDECIVNADPEIMDMVISSMIMKSAESADKKIKIHVYADKKVCLEVKCDSPWVTGNRDAGKVWSKYSISDRMRAEELGSSGIGLVPAATMLRAHKAKFGCAPEQDGTVLWFELKKAD
jgi:hypothetical protein